MGACLQQIRNSAEVLQVEANSVSDNPLVFAEDNDIISGGNFHAEPVAMAADNLARHCRNRQFVRASYGTSHRQRAIKTAAILSR